MTYQDMLDAGIDVQGEVVFREWDYEKDLSRDVTLEEAKYREIKYIYPDTMYTEYGCKEPVIVIEVCNEEGE